MGEGQNSIDKIFDLLDEWRNFPAYQLERRADIFFAVYLPKIIKHKLGLEVTGILPEFPVRIGSINSKVPINKSFKIDYLAICEKSNKVLLVELKTDILSRRIKQDNYLESAKNLNIFGLVQGLMDIYQATIARKKYENYFNKLVEKGWLVNEGGHYKNNSHDYTIEIVYIQPCGEETSKTIITFDDIAKALADCMDSVTSRFIKSLELWKQNPNLS